MNEKDANFCSFSIGLEPATRAYEAVTQSTPPPRCAKILEQMQKTSVASFSRGRGAKDLTVEVPKELIPIFDSTSQVSFWTYYICNECRLSFILALLSEKTTCSTSKVAKSTLGVFRWKK